MSPLDPETLPALLATVIDIGWVLLAIAAAISSGMMLTFSNFVMPALGRLPSDAAARAMQRINEDVLNPFFLTLFIGTGPAMAAWAALQGFTEGVDGATASAAAIYLLGVVGITMAGNVPLNRRLAAVDAHAVDARAWRRFARPWLRWNHARALAAAASAALALAG